MKKSQKIIPKRLKIGILFLAGIAAAGAALAVNPFVDIQYPVQELGNCQDKEECKAYCDEPENMEPCLGFAEKIGMMSEKEVQKAKKMASVSAEMPGPGGCIGDKECKAFCDKMENIRECIRFAEENNLIPPEELEEAKKVIKAIDQGLTPPKCGGKKECDIYCQKPENMEKCIEFGIAAGIMSEKEQEEAKKMLKALKAGVKPPNCAGKKECDIYCQKPENMEECIEFGVAAGFMPPEEAENAKKMLKALKAGVKPPNCRGDKECDEYCRKNAENMAECMEFSIAAGFAPPEEAENMERTLKAIKQGIMPPDCRGEEECRDYCGKEENMQRCIDFNIAAGFMTQEQAEIMKKTGGKGPGGCVGEQECQAFCNNPDNARECIQFGVTMGDMTQEEADRMIKEMEMGRMGPGQQGEGMAPNIQMMQGGGPGGCKTPEECKNFCDNPDNAQTCREFKPQGSQNGGREMAPPQGNEFAPPMGPGQGEGGQWQPGQPGQMPPQPMTPEQEQEVRQRMAPQEGEGGGWQPGMGLPTEGGMIQGPSQGIEGGAEGWQSPEGWVQPPIGEPMQGGGQAPMPQQFPAGQQPPVFQEGQTPMLQPAPYISEPGMGTGEPAPSGEQAPLAPSGGGGGEAPAPQGLLTPFKSFLGSIADFLSR